MGIVVASYGDAERIRAGAILAVYHRRADGLKLVQAAYLPSAQAGLDKVQGEF